MLLHLVPLARLVTESLVQLARLLSSDPALAA